MFAMPGFGQPDPVQQSIQMAMAYNLLPKDATTEAFKKDMLAKPIMERIALYRELRDAARADWSAQVADFQNSTPPVAVTDPRYVTAEKEFKDEVKLWSDKMKAAGAKLEK